MRVWLDSRAHALQALVEHFSQKGQPDAVERAVLHMDIASLDLNQVSCPTPARPPLLTSCDCTHAPLCLVTIVYLNLTAIMLTAAA